MIGDLLGPLALAIAVEAWQAQELYDECLPRRGPGDPMLDSSCPLVSVLHALVNHGRLKPLLRFATYVYDRLDDDAKVVLDTRLKDIEPEWRRLAVVPSGTSQHTFNTDNYAIIQFIPTPQEQVRDAQDQYQALAWLVLRGKRCRERLLYEDSVSRENIKVIIRQINQSINARRGTVPRDQICLEMFLPDELFAERLDQCLVDVPGLPDPLPVGRLSPVVFRWNDRAVDPLIRADLPALELRFRSLTTHGRFSSPIPPYEPNARLGACAWVEPDLWKAIDVHAAVIHQKDLVLCLLTCAPRGDIKRSALRGLLTGGVPAVLWSRADGLDGLSNDLLELLVASGPISELCHTIFEARNSHPLKEHLSLLWENPDRMPPDLRLGAPRKRGKT